MRVLVTGGTGFVGSHTVAAVAEAGHDVRVLARSPERVRPALDPLGVGEVEVAVGDVTDEAAVHAALEGCDAVIHGASVYSIDPRSAGDIRRTNVAGTELVLRLASEAGLDPIVHVSSIVAMVDRDGVLTPDTEPGTPPGAYFRSKADSDRVARRFQTDGAPVVITYPATVWGAHDPHLGESCQIAINALKGADRISMAGGLVVCGVGDVARLHAAVLEPGRGPRRYFVPMESVELREALDRFGAITGRRFPTTMLPTPLALAGARLADALRRVSPVRLPLEYQGAYFLSRFHSWERWDDSRTIEEFGFARPDVDELFTETLQWLYAEGHVSAKLAGRIAEGAAGA